MNEFTLEEVKKLAKGYYAGEYDLNSQIRIELEKSWVKGFMYAQRNFLQDNSVSEN